MMTLGSAGSGRDLLALSPSTINISPHRLAGPLCRLSPRKVLGPIVPFERPTSRLIGISKKKASVALIRHLNFALTS